MVGMSTVTNIRNENTGEWSIERGKIEVPFSLTESKICPKIKVTAQGS